MTDWWWWARTVSLFLYHLVEAWVKFLVPRSWYLKDVSRDLVLVTGAGSGLGRLLALRFSRLGSRVVLWDLDQASNEETAAMIAKEGGEAHAYRCDVTDREEVYGLAAKIKATLGPVTILINNAGIVSGGLFLQNPDHKIEASFKVNAIAHFWTVKAFLPDMMEKNHGHIVSIASIAGHVGMYGLSDYSASKFAAVGLMEALAEEFLHLGYSNIHTTTICPCYINTGMFAGVQNCSGIYPFLDAEYVANRTVTAIRNNQMIVYISRLFYPIIAIRSFLPFKCTLLLQAMTNGAPMKYFTGRGGVKKN